MPIAKETQLEIDLGALEWNFRYLRSRILPGTKFLAVVKAFSYGHDAPLIAGKLESLGVDYFAVAYAQEGVALRKGGIKAPILVLHPSPVNFETIIDHRLEPGLYSLKILRQFTATVKAKKKAGYPVHLNFNTGLNRLGFGEGQLQEVIEYLKAGEYIRPISVFSHLVASEDPSEREFTLAQIGQFERIAATLDKALPHSLMKHMLNTSGIIHYPEAQYDMVRSGIGLYGFGNEAAVDSRLRPVATLKTVISQLHDIAKGDSVGYNRGFIAKAPVRTATLPLGHADGIGRQYGKGKGFVYIHGRKAPIVGNVCMDMIMVDVTGIDCEEGDEVVVFGGEASAEALAAAAGTISYELLTGISQRVPRLVLNPISSG